MMVMTCSDMDFSGPTASYLEQERHGLSAFYAHKTHVFVAGDDNVHVWEDAYVQD